VDADVDVAQVARETAGTPEQLAAQHLSSADPAVAEPWADQIAVNGARCVLARCGQVRVVLDVKQ
jgi:hypothetical protein